MQNKPLIFVLFLAFLMTTLLSACGSKGDLYQTPAPESAENEQTEVTNDNQVVETSSKKQP